jgi:hypothetical protein
VNASLQPAEGLVPIDRRAGFGTPSIEGNTIILSGKEKEMLALIATILSTWIWTGGGITVSDSW